MSYTLSVDVYSFAIVLWEIAAQVLPWQDVDFMNVIFEAVMAGQRPPIDPEWPVLTQSSNELFMYSYMIFQ